MGKTCSHMTRNDRIVIEGSLNRGESLTTISKKIGKNVSTVGREVKNRAAEVEKGCPGHAFNDCARRGDCPLEPKAASWALRESGGQRKRPRRRPEDCGPGCVFYEEERCPLLSKPPYVCNACPRDGSCTLSRRVYDAERADRNYRLVLTEHRKGVCASEAELDHYADELRPLIRDQGFSVHAALAACRDKVPFSERTVYSYIDAGLLPGIGNTSLPRKASNRPRRKSETHYYKVDRTCLDGRRWEDFLAYRREHPDVPVVEADTVQGRRDEPDCILTVHFVQPHLQLGFKRDANTSASVSRIFRGLQDVLGVQLYRELFPLVLADNGSEFSDPLKIECSEDGQALSRLFYCQPMAPHQKGSCEVNHELIRRVIPRGSSLKGLTQADVSLVMSHINSYPRPDFGGRSAYDMFCFIYGEAGEQILRMLGITRIPTKDIVLTPALLK